MQTDDAQKRFHNKPLVMQPLLSLRAEKLRSKVEKKWQIIHYEHFSIRGVIWELFAQHSVPRGARRHR